MTTTLTRLTRATGRVLSGRSTTERVLIVGTSPLAIKLIEELAAHPECVSVVVGVADDAGGASGFPYRELIAGPVERLGALVRELRPDRIVVALTDRRGRLPVGDLLDARVHGVDVEDAAELYERLTGKLAIETLTPSLLISSKDFRKTHADLAFGHALSLIVSALMLVLFLPVFVLIAIAIKLDSPGPVFFVHERAGAAGRRFRLLKFRTMRPAERATSEWVRDNNDRITLVGQWLRKFRLDELPQLINVVRGEMNLIGPRPHPVSNLELFTKSIPYYSLRAIVRPGLTGWAQVRQGYANSLEEETEKMRYDLYYIKHMSAWLDICILLRTVQTVLAGAEATPARRAARPARVRWSSPVYFVHRRAPLAVRPRPAVQFVLVDSPRQREGARQ
jgi:exopolysaccharide biosynthesis polyprenyl glycosylphosphotransferase